MSKCTFYFIRKFQTVSQSGCPVAFLPSVHESSSCSAFLSALGIVSLLNFEYCHRRAVIARGLISISLAE